MDALSGSTETVDAYVLGSDYSLKASSNSAVANTLYGIFGYNDGPGAFVVASRGQSIQTLTLSGTDLALKDLWADSHVGADHSIGIANPIYNGRYICVSGSGAGTDYIFDVKNRCIVAGLPSVGGVKYGWFVSDKGWVSINRINNHINFSLYDTFQGYEIVDRF